MKISRTLSMKFDKLNMNRRAYELIIKKTIMKKNVITSNINLLINALLSTPQYRLPESSDSTQNSLGNSIASLWLYNHKNHNGTAHIDLTFHETFSRLKWHQYDLLDIFVIYLRALSHKDCSLFSILIASIQRRH